MKRILQIFNEPITYGGEESIIYNMLSTLDLKKQYNVDIFTPYYIKNKNLVDLIKNNGGNIFSFNKDYDAKKIENSFFNEVRDFIKENNNYDIFHINVDTIKSIYEYSAICRKYNEQSKIIIHTHNIECKMNMLQRIARYFHKYKMEKNIDYIFGDSKEVMLNKFSKNLQNKIYILNNGVDIKSLKYDEKLRKEIRDRYNIQNKFLIGHIGEYTKNKNQKFLIDVFSEVLKINHNVLLMLVGDGELKKVVEDYARKLGVYDKVIFVGETDEINKYYQAFDIFVFPSIYERVGLVGIEAQVSGLPMLISKNITNDIYISNATVYLSLNDIKTWVDLILKIKNNNNDEYNREKLVIDYDKYDKNETFRIVSDIYSNN